MGASRTKSELRRLAYHRWRNMMARCYDKSHPAYHRYGKRGIRCATRWHDFETYYADTGDSPGPEYSLDRIDSASGYDPSNIRWATWGEQRRNQRDVVVYIFEGKKQTLTDWAREKNIPPQTLLKRVKVLGWPLEKAFSTPARRWKRKDAKS